MPQPWRPGSVKVVASSVVLPHFFSAGSAASISGKPTCFLQGLLLAACVVSGSVSVSVRVCVCEWMCAYGVWSPTRAKPGLSRVVSFHVQSHIYKYTRSLALSLSLSLSCAMLFTAHAYGLQVLAAPNTVGPKRVGVLSPSLPGSRPPWSRPSPHTRVATRHIW